MIGATVKVLWWTPATLAWLILIAATAASWVLAHNLGQLSNSDVFAALGILGVAVFKVRLIALYFMDLRDAPPTLRIGTEVYAVVLFVLLVSFYLAGR